MKDHPQKEIKDAQLIHQLRAGTVKENREALKQIYRNCYGSVAQYVRDNRGSEADAEDVFQDSLIIFYNQVKKGELELSSSVKTYLFAIAKNQWLKRLRDRQLHSELKKNITPEEAVVDSHRELAARESKELLAQLVENLGQECRRILTMFYYERLRMKDIAEKLGLTTAQAAKNKKSRCLKKLRERVLASKFLREQLGDKE